MLAKFLSLALAGLSALTTAIPDAYSLGNEVAADPKDRLVFAHFMVSSTPTI